MHIHIVWVRKTKDTYLDDGITEYCKRLKAFAKVNISTLSVRISSQYSQKQIQTMEANAISNTLRSDFLYFFLDEKGKECNSKHFSKMIEDVKNTQGKIGFVIGGAYGLDSSFKKEERLISLSRLTFTHQMVRLILLEQLYRALTIIHGKNYHHA